jgi:hypothetical protein
LGTEKSSEKGKAFFVFRQTSGDHDRRGALPPGRGGIFKLVFDISDKYGKIYKKRENY